MATVRFSNVSKAIGGNRVLSDIALEIPAKRVTAVLGESGSGKSTLLNHINGLLVPDKGTVEVFGTKLDYSDLRKLRRRMGYAVQAIGLFPHLRLYDNVALIPRLSGWNETKIQKRTQQLMSLLMLAPELAERYPHEVSGGQRQRAGIMRALMLSPELLLLDEAFSGIDPIARVSIHQEFQNLLAAEPATTVLVTHDAAEAVRLADYLVILRDGAILQKGNASDVMQNPNCDFVARLFKDVL